MRNQVDPALHKYMQELVNNERSVWDGFYSSGGWGMYPTTLFGFILVLAACLYLLRPERRFLPVVMASAGLTVASGMLATFTGLMVVFTYVQVVEPAIAPKVAIVGAAQVLTNMVFAMLLLILGGLATLGGVVRRALRNDDAAHADR
jgi:hypothetical protein